MKGANDTEDGEKVVSLDSDSHFYHATLPKTRKAPMTPKTVKRWLASNQNATNSIKHCPKASKAPMTSKTVKRWLASNQNPTNSIQHMSTRHQLLHGGQTKSAVVFGGSPTPSIQTIPRILASTPMKLKTVVAFYFAPHPPRAAQDVPQ